MKSIKIKCPDCGSLGRVESVSNTTLVFYPMVFDSKGQPRMMDGNITTTEHTCTKCGCIYVTKSQHGNIINLEKI